ncbi:unnamed protein product [Ectocarpus sp. 6 AP-2014]
MSRQRPLFRLYLHWARPRRNLPLNLRRHLAQAQKRLDAAFPRPHLRPRLHLHWARPRRDLPYNLRNHPARAQKLAAYLQAG